jgi:hypothetical protein
LVGSLRNKQLTHKNSDEIVRPTDNYVLISINSLFEPVIIVNPNKSLSGANSQDSKYTKKVSSYFGLLCRGITELWGRSG